MPSVRQQYPSWVHVPFVAVAVTAVIFVVDLLVSVDGTPRAGLRVVVIVAAIVVAGTFFQRWSIVPARHLPHHVMAGLGLVGGALVASSAFGLDAGVFGNEVTGALGLAALWVAVIAARTTHSTPTGVGS